MWELWFILFVLFVLKTIENSNLLHFSLSLTSLFTLFYTFYNHSLSFSLVFFVIALTLIYLIFYCLTSSLKIKNTFSSSSPDESLEHLIGKLGTVYYPIGSSNLRSGTIRLDGETWRALSSTQKPLSTGTCIKVQDIKGVHLIVSPFQSPVIKKR